MNENFNEIIISKIRSMLMPNVKLSEYLAKLLNISVPSSYRRIKGEIPFNLDEVSILAAEFKFSVDEIIGRSNLNQILFMLQSNSYHNGQETFYRMLYYYRDYVIAMSKAGNEESINTMNKMLVVFTIGYENLFKFYYYKWMHQTLRSSMYFSFSEVIIPAEIMSLYEEIKLYIPYKVDLTFIFDQNIFFNIVMEIEYFHKRGLIKEDELFLIKKDLYNILNYMEQNLREGENGLGGISRYYYSTLNIESNTSYIRSGDTVTSYFWVYSGGPMITVNCEATTLHKRWIDSLKKYSVLITRSNERLQTDFIDKQYESLNIFEHV